jgi:hypothetical protein
MRVLIVLSVFLFATLATGQNDSLKQNESSRKNLFEIALYRIESNSHTFYDKPEPKFFFGLTYERLFQKWSLSATAEYGQNKINDYCRNCYDSYQGIGNLSEVNLFLGYKYVINRKSTSKFKLFIGNDIYYSYANYIGNFTGGQSGVYKFSAYLNSFGIQQKIGLDYYPAKFIRLSASSWLRAGLSHRNHEFLNIGPNLGTEYSWTVIQARIAFLF